MYLLALLFSIIENFVPVTKQQFFDLKKEAEEWEIIALSVDEEVKKTKIQQIYFKVNQSWGWRLIYALLYLPLSNWIMNANNPGQPNE